LFLPLRRKPMRLPVMRGKAEHEPLKRRAVSWGRHRISAAI